MRRWRALAVAPVVALLLTGSVLAQGGTPEPDPTENPRLVDPSECTIEPRSTRRSPSNLAARGRRRAGAVPRLDHPTAERDRRSSRHNLHQGDRAPVLACFNAGDIPRAAALMTDNGIKRAYWGLTISPESRQIASSVSPAPRCAANRGARAPDYRHRRVVPSRWACCRIRRAQQALLPPAGPETLLFIFRNEGDHFARRRLGRFFDRTVRFRGIGHARGIITI